LVFSQNLAKDQDQEDNHCNKNGPDNISGNVPNYLLLVCFSELDHFGLLTLRYDSVL